MMKLSQNSSEINCVKFTSDGRYIASGSVDGKIKLWFLEAKKEVFILNEAAGENVKCIEFTNDNQQFVSGGSSRYLKLWDLQTGKQKKIFHCLNKQIIHLQFSPDDQFLIALSGEGKSLEIFSIYTMIRVKSYQFYFELIGGHMSNDYSQMVVANVEQDLIFLDFQKLVEEKTNLLKIVPEMIGTHLNSGFFSYANNFKVLISSKVQGILGYDIQTKELLVKNEKIEPDKIAISPDDKLIACADHNQIAILNYQTLECSKLLFSQRDLKQQVINMCFSIQHQYLACLKHQSQYISIWNLIESKEIKKLDHETIALHVLFTKNNKFVLTSGEYILVWNIETLDSIHKIDDSVYMTEMSLTNDGQFLAVGTKLSQFNIYKTNNWKEEKKIHILGGNKQTDCKNNQTLEKQKQRNTQIFSNLEVCIIQYSRNDSQIATAWNDFNIRIYDLLYDQLVFTYDCESQIYSIDFSIENDYLMVILGNKFDIYTNFHNIHWNPKQKKFDRQKTQWYLFQRFASIQEMDMNGLELEKVKGLNKKQIKTFEQLADLQFNIEYTDENQGTLWFLFDKPFLSQQQQKNQLKYKNKITMNENLQALIQYQQVVNKINVTQDIIENQQQQQKKFPISSSPKSQDFLEKISHEYRKQEIKQEKLNRETQALKLKQSKIKIVPNMKLIKTNQDESSFDQIAHFRTFNTKERKIQSYQSVLQKLPEKYFIQPTPVFYQMGKIEYKSIQISAQLENFHGDKKLIVESKTTLHEFKDIIRKQEKLSSKEMFLIYAGNNLIKANQDIGTLQQIYGDFQDGWLYLTIIRTGFKHKPIKQYRNNGSYSPRDKSPSKISKNFNLQTNHSFSKGSLYKQCIKK